MQLPRAILVPTDFSEHAEHALDYAVTLAEKLGATVHLLNVAVPAIVESVSVASSVSPSDLNERREALAKLVAAHGKVSFGPNLLAIGDPRHIIHQSALRIAADLIVMGTHGRRGVPRMVVGSVAESVARTAPCPILLVRKRLRTQLGAS